jgi:hypothetical protein
LRTAYDILRRLFLLMLTAALLPSAAVCAQSSRRAEPDEPSDRPRVQAAQIVHTSALPSSTPAPSTDRSIAPSECGSHTASPGDGGTQHAFAVITPPRRFARAVSDSALVASAKSGASREAGEHPCSQIGAP